MLTLALETALLILTAFLLGYVSFFRLAARLRPASPYRAAVRAPKPAAPPPRSAPPAALEPLPAPPQPPAREADPDVYRWAAWWENGKIILGRSVPSEPVRAELLSLVRRIHAGVRIEDRMKVREAEPEGWWIAASSAVRALSDLSQGRVSLDDLVMTIEGRAATNEGYDRLKTTGVGLEGAAFSVQSPYLARPLANRPPPPPAPPTPRRPPAPVAQIVAPPPSPAPASPPPAIFTAPAASSAPSPAPAVPPAPTAPSPVQLELGSMLDPGRTGDPQPATSYAEIAARLASLPKHLTAERRADQIGARPLALPGPRESGADDLKRVRGIGPKNEKLLNGLGVYHFDQIAAWTPEVVRWVEAYLAFPGRVGREDWIGQCAALAAGRREPAATDGEGD